MVAGPNPQPPILPYSSPGGTPCPKCGSAAKKLVTFTWWGGLLGPKMLNHVKCLGCGAGYNGKTGRSNDTAIMIYIGVCFGVAVLGAILFFFARA